MRMMARAPGPGAVARATMVSSGWGRDISSRGGVSPPLRAPRAGKPRPYQRSLLLRRFLQHLLPPSPELARRHLVLQRGLALLALDARPAVATGRGAVRFSRRRRVG